MFVLKNVIETAKGMLNNIFQSSFNKILSQPLNHYRSYMPAPIFPEHGSNLVAKNIKDMLQKKDKYRISPNKRSQSDAKHR